MLKRRPFTSEVEGLCCLFKIVTYRPNRRKPSTLFASFEGEAHEIRQNTQPCRANTERSLPLFFDKLPLFGPSEKHASHYASRNRHATQNRDTHQPFLCDFFIDQPPQALCLRVGRFMIQKPVVVSFCLCVVSKLEVAES